MRRLATPCACACTAAAAAAYYQSAPAPASFRVNIGDLEKNSLRRQFSLRVRSLATGRALLASRAFAQQPPPLKSPYETAGFNSWGVSGRIVARNSKFPYPIDRVEHRDDEGFAIPPAAGERVATVPGCDATNLRRLYAQAALEANYGVGNQTLTASNSRKSYAQHKAEQKDKSVLIEENGVFQPRGRQELPEQQLKLRRLGPHFYELAVKLCNMLQPGVVMSGESDHYNFVFPPLDFMGFKAQDGAVIVHFFAAIIRCVPADEAEAVIRDIASLSSQNVSHFVKLIETLDESTSSVAGSADSPTADAGNGHDRSNIATEELDNANDDGAAGSSPQATAIGNDGVIHLGAEPFLLNDEDSELLQNLLSRAWNYRFLICALHVAGPEYHAAFERIADDMHALGTAIGVFLPSAASLVRQIDLVGDTLGLDRLTANALASHFLRQNETSVQEALLWSGTLLNVVNQRSGAAVLADVDRVLYEVLVDDPDAQRWARSFCETPRCAPQLAARVLHVLETL